MVDRIGQIAVVACSTVICLWIHFPLRRFVVGFGCGWVYCANGGLNGSHTDVVI